ncbi:MAG: prephenate dehydratase [Deltaproteobacteria bacterium]|nr:prephenate dehydratase [Candidatus Anaeroferrophillacea bacterium]
MTDNGCGTPIGELRKTIDGIDRELLELLNRRAALAVTIGERKLAAGGELYVPAREQEIHLRLEEQNRGPLPNRAVRHIFREVISACLALEKPLQVAYLGPRGTFTHLAARKFYGYSAELKPAAGIREVFDNVARGRCAYGVVPVENTTEGVVSHTLDMFLEHPVLIGGEILLKITHDLLNQSGDPTDVRRIHSHPQAIAQCRGYLERAWPEIPLIEAASTARAAAIAAEETGAAAIANEYAASLYGLRMVDGAIQDINDNFTRFLIITTRETPRVAGEDYKTTVLFAGRDRAGALFELLQPFADHDVNLTKIESRPRRGEPWQYIFFLDLDGHRDDPPVAAALAELETRSRFFKIVGSYVRGRL